MRAIVSLFLAGALLATAPGPATAHPLTAAPATSLNLATQAEDRTGLKRLAGDDRYATSATVAKAWPPGTKVAYVVSGRDFPDALAAASRAGKDRAPVLLSDPTSLSTQTRDALKRLRPKSIVVVGGTGAVSGKVLDQLRPLASSGAVQRVAGTDRYRTATALTRQHQAGARRVYLASGQNFPDALAGAALAGYQKAPMLLTDGRSLDPSSRAELERLRPDEIVILGGTNVVSDRVAQLASSAAATDEVSRLAGPDRYATAAIVAAQFPSDISSVFVGSGENFPDALTGSALAGRRGAPMLLTKADVVPPPTARALERQRPDKVYLLGGKKAIGNNVSKQFEKAISGTANNAPKEPDYGGKISWQENFDGKALNRSTWTADEQRAGAINAELQEYTPRSENVEVRDGTLRLTARREAYNGAEYTSGKVKTLNKLWFQYGYIAARIRVPKGQGLWPAFWTLGRTDGNKWWPANGEIDILESVNDMNFYQGGVHGGEDRPRTQSDDWWHINRKTQDVNLADGDFHLYAMNWKKGRITFYVDNVEMGAISESDMPAGKDWPFDRLPHYLLMNVAVGGTWPGSPTDSTPLPATMEVDWVRAYDSTVTKGSRGKGKP